MPQLSRIGALAIADPALAKEAIKEAITLTGSRSKAAKVLEVSERQLFRLQVSLGVKVNTKNKGGRPPGDMVKTAKRKARG